MKAISPVRSVRSCLEAVCCLSEQSLGIARGTTTSGSPTTTTGSVGLGLALSQSKAFPSAAADEASGLLDDMNGCYSKLRELVPGIPQGSQLSQVEILQHVIDYIFDLQIVLEEEQPTGEKDKKKRRKARRTRRTRSRSKKDHHDQPAASQAAELSSELCSKDERTPCH